jgi:hypothetical protein
MNTFILLITLLTPKGDVALITERYPSAVACEIGKQAAIKAVQRKSIGFSIREAVCHPNAAVMASK